ncbi:STAS domain-containing protein [Streptomyces sp. NBC_00841]|uniref:STAS domain-containing protein n=1 Tax=unclassified Streptomyces TaxID=2593676 RepID=UPI00225796E7|nr:MULTISPECIES: STAS domain-containing protein [unclassified Streptomyces]MCX4534194.1 STAS domain-containing protein [Streptomyces sp. NBC_01669]WSA00443.1 STAS domain-containing protein [Streptomyces sp. NBC_00841]
MRGRTPPLLLTAGQRFDLETVPRLRQALADARHEGSRQTILDISQVCFGDSSFLHELLAAHYSHHRSFWPAPSHTNCVSSSS